MTSSDPRHPHLADGYSHGDMAARPAALRTSGAEGTTTGVSGTLTVTPGPQEAPVETPAAFVQQENPLENMTLPELKQLAKARGVRVTRGVTKAQLRARLK